MDGKCQREGCGRQAEVVDYRPSYKDEDGDWDCFGKVVSCKHCTGLTHEQWNGSEPVEEGD